MRSETWVQMNLYTFAAGSAKENYTSGHGFIAECGLCFHFKDRKQSDINIILSIGFYICYKIKSVIRSAQIYCLALK